MHVSSKATPRIRVVSGSKFSPLRNRRIGVVHSLAITHHEHLAEADRLIAACKDRIARQREVIASAYENGYPTVLPVLLLRALEENLRFFGKHRQLILDQLKKGE